MVDRVRFIEDLPWEAVFSSMLDRAGGYNSFAALRATFGSMDKAGDRYVFDTGGNEYRLIASVAFAVRTGWVKVVLTHAEYDREKRFSAPMGVFTA